jgi:hypothetical protein
MLFEFSGPFTPLIAGGALALDCLLRYKMRTLTLCCQSRYASSAPPELEPFANLDILGRFESLFEACD